MVFRYDNISGIVRFYDNYIFSFTYYRINLSESIYPPWSEVKKIELFGEYLFNTINRQCSKDFLNLPLIIKA